MACAVNEVRTNAKAALVALFAANSITYSVLHVVDEQHAVDLATQKDGRAPKLAGIVAARLTPDGIEMPDTSGREFLRLELSVVLVETDYSTPSAVVDSLWETFDVARQLTTEDVGLTGPLVNRPVRLKLTGAGMTRVPTMATGTGAGVLVITFATEGDLWT